MPSALLPSPCDPLLVLGAGAAILVQAAVILTLLLGRRRAADLARRDGEERLRLRAEIERGEQRFQAVFDNAAVGMALMDGQGQYRDVNKRLLEMVGYEREEFLGLSFLDITHPEDREGSEAKFDQAKTTPGSPFYEIVKRYRRKDGETFWALAYGALVRDRENGEEASVVIVVDLDARVKAKQALAASERRYRTLFESACDAILVLDKGVIADVNRAGLAVFRCDRDALVGRAPLDLSPAVQPDGVRSDEASRRISARVYQGEAVSFEWTHRRCDGSDFLSEVSMTPVELLGEKLALACIRDVTDRRRDQERYRVLFESAKDAIFILKDDRFADLNPAAATMFAMSRDEMIGLSPTDIFSPPHPDGRDPSRVVLERLRRAEQGETLVFECEHRRRDGSEFPAEVMLAGMDLFGERRVIAFVRDIAERRRMQEMMAQAEKMLSLGGLAAGLAHEINNPLGIVLQGAQGALRRIDPSIEGNAEAAARLGLDLKAVHAYFEERNILRYLNGVNEAARRAATMVRNMLDFSRRGEPAKNMCDLNDVLDRALDIAANDYDLKKKYAFREVRIARAYDAALPRTPCSATEIEQVVLNLVRNAAQAMASSGADAPRLTLRTMRENEWVRIELEDNGPGVPQDKLQRIFEPFYTTKAPGEGTGLGLSVSHYIISTNHHGQIFAESTPDKGTKFVIRLPADAGGLPGGLR